MKLFNTALLFVLSVASVARADDKSDCLATYRQAQIHRKQGDLLQSRDSLITCSRDVCPAIVKQDCVAWLAEVEQSVGSIVVTVTDGGGKPITAARVLIDGRVVASSIDGRPIEVSPGTHVARVEVDGAAPVDQTVVISRGERQHATRFVVALSSPSPHAKDSGPAEATRRRPVPLSVILLGGLGIAGLAEFGIVGTIGLVGTGNLEGTCKPACDPAKVDPLRAEYIAAYVGLGVGGAALIAASILFFTRPSIEPTKASWLTLDPSAHGMSLSFRHTF